MHNTILLALIFWIVIAILAVLVRNYFR